MEAASQSTASTDSTASASSAAGAPSSSADALRRVELAEAARAAELRDGDASSAVGLYAAAARLYERAARRSGCPVARPGLQARAGELGARSRWLAQEIARRRELAAPPAEFARAEPALTLRPLDGVDRSLRQAAQRRARGSARAWARAGSQPDVSLAARQPARGAAEGLVVPVDSPRGGGPLAAAHLNPLSNEAALLAEAPAAGEAQSDGADAPLVLQLAGGGSDGADEETDTDTEGSGQGGALGQSDDTRTVQHGERSTPPVDAETRAASPAVSHHAMTPRRQPPRRPRQLEGNANVARRQSSATSAAVATISFVGASSVDAGQQQIQPLNFTSVLPPPARAVDREGEEAPLSFAATAVHSAGPTTDAERLQAEMDAASEELRQMQAVERSLESEAANPQATQVLIELKQATRDLNSEIGTMRSLRARAVAAERRSRAQRATRQI